MSEEQKKEEATPAAAPAAAQPQGRTQAPQQGGPGGQGGGQQMMRHRKRQQKRDDRRKSTVVIDENEIELTERVVKMSRVAKVVKGGRRFSFNALTIVGDSDQYVGLGFGKAKEVPEAIRKSIEDGKKSLFRVRKQGNTIPHQIVGQFKSARVLLKPAAPGTGIIAGAAVRAVVELGGIKDVLTKALGSSNSLNIAKATIDGLRRLNSVNDAKARRDISLGDIFGEYSKTRRQEKRAALGIGAGKETAAAAPAAKEE